MRIWSLHPMHLDSKGLVALWRETLLAKKVLEGKTKGYKNHPQLERFKLHPNPLSAINSYLEAVCKEAFERNFCFDKTKIGKEFTNQKIPVTDKQLEYEWQHLQNKLKTRDPKKYEENKNKTPTPHPLFKIVPGEVEDWEKQ